MEFSTLTYQRNNKKILKGISFKIHASGINWVFGPNGSGKTSILKILSGMETGFKGKLPTELIHAKPGQIGFLLEHGAFYGHLTIMENLFLFVKSYKISQVGILDTLDYWELTSHRKNKVAHLSVGLRSRFSLVLALINRPRYLLLDEPESALDFRGKLLLVNCIEAWRKAPEFIVIVSHYPHHITTKDHLLVLDAGRSIYQGPVHDFMADTRHYQHEYLSYLHCAMVRTAK